MKGWLETENILIKIYQLLDRFLDTKKTSKWVVSLQNLSTYML